MTINKISPVINDISPIINKELKLKRKDLLNLLVKQSQRVSFLDNSKTIDGITKKATMDIYSKNPYPSGTLSNFKRCDFEIDGIKCGSIEGVLQSLKVIIPSKFEDLGLWYARMQLQQKVCQYANNKAKRMGNFLNLFKSEKTLNWRGKQMDRFSKEYQRFLKRVFEARYLADPEFRSALKDTKNFNYSHVIGKHDKTQTILTEGEFIGMLYHLRKKFKIQ